MTFHCLLGSGSIAAPLDLVTPKNKLPKVMAICDKEEVDDTHATAASNFGCSAHIVKIEENITHLYNFPIDLLARILKGINPIAFSWQALQALVDKANKKRAIARPDLLRLFTIETEFDSTWELPSDLRRSTP